MRPGGGHEPCGAILALGPGATGRAVGDRVIVYHYAGCGACRFCRAGWEQLCARGGRRVYGFGTHGGNADALVIPARALVPLPDELSYEEGAAIACGTGTADARNVARLAAWFAERHRIATRPSRLAPVWT